MTARVQPTRRAIGPHIDVLGRPIGAQSDAVHAIPAPLPGSLPVDIDTVAQSSPTGERIGFVTPAPRAIEDGPRCLRSVNGRHRSPNQAAVASSTTSLRIAFASQTSRCASESRSNGECVAELKAGCKSLWARLFGASLLVHRAPSGRSGVAPGREWGGTTCKANVGDGCRRSAIVPARGDDPLSEIELDLAGAHRPRARG